MSTGSGRSAAGESRHVRTRGPSLPLRALTEVMKRDGEKTILASAELTAADVAAKAGAGPAVMTRRVRRRFGVERRRVAGLDVVAVEPRHREPGREIVYLHGGAYCYPMLTAHWWLVAALASDNAARVHVVFSPLAPEGTAAAVVPGVAAVVSVLTEESGVPLVLAGDSAGGGLALAVALHLREAVLPLPAHLVLFAPWLDLTMEHPELDASLTADPNLAAPGLRHAAALYAGGLDLADPRVSPARAEVAGLPPATVVLGTRDGTYPDARDWATRAERGGVDLATFTAGGGFHVFIAATMLPESRRARRFVAGRLAESWGSRVGA